MQSLNFYRLLLLRLHKFFRIHDRVFFKKPLLGALLKVSTSLVDSMDICFMVYNSNYTFASVTMAWEKMKAGE